MLKWYSLGDFNVGLLWDRCGHYKIREGTAGLIDRLIADGKPDVKVSSPVKKVTQSADWVEVTVEGGATYRARRVICTVPLNTLHNVAFHPPLMPAKITASKERHTGAGLKFYFTIDKNVGKFLASAPYPFPISMDALIGVKRLNQTGKLFLRRFLWQSILHRVETAFLGHSAFRRDVRMARRIVADNNHGEAWRYASIPREASGPGLDDVNHGGSNLPAVDRGSGHHLTHSLGFV